MATSLQDYAPRTDVAIELGGEDAKIIYFTGGIDQRNERDLRGRVPVLLLTRWRLSCRQTLPASMNMPKITRRSIPSRPGAAYLPNRISQPLINDGATIEDLAASIFQAVVNQTISGLACGKPIRGNVAFLGGPLHFLSELRAAFIRTSEAHRRRHYRA